MAQASAHRRRSHQYNIFQFARRKFLESLGKPKRAYLTALEEKVLSLLELEIIN
ncbi:hypothetical protein COO91_10083 (plasmid) [Nostoc flagelliforme CCNUN1]|uniref:Uncharacterized protein n=1 Tax=Nostoc flagelliforme CCNUN1 TaxID=2038116 RepID=A0A2K8T8A3_9NOSO|nr:hypothetical protein [Nostoc flagelliforme]AUB43880.1 hypothetical protein COO91_10083 [Nostoc flagelliforme CCNUN1]